MQDVEGGRKFNADCAFALAGLGIATTGLILALGPFAAGAAAMRGRHARGARQSPRGRDGLLPALRSKALALFHLL